MAYTLKKKTKFYFALEEDTDETYFLPSYGELSFEDASTMTKIDEEKNVVKRGEKIRDFILKYNPGLKDKDIGDMEYFEIFNAYGAQQGEAQQLGE